MVQVVNIILTANAQNEMHITKFRLAHYTDHFAKKNVAGSSMTNGLRTHSGIDDFFMHGYAIFAVSIDGMRFFSQRWFNVMDIRRSERPVYIEFFRAGDQFV